MSDAKPKTGLWLRILLGVSLALNLLIVGIAVGAFLRFAGPDGVRPPPRSFGAALYRALPDEDRHALRSQMFAGHEAHRADRLRDIRDLTEALRRSPFDPGALSVVVERQAMHRETNTRAMLTGWIDRVAAMSDAERAAYADRLTEGVRRSRQRRH